MTVYKNSIRRKSGIRKRESMADDGFIWMTRKIIIPIEFGYTGRRACLNKLVNTKNIIQQRKENHLSPFSRKILGRMKT